ncbi:SDR family oxidoreductase [Chloroflexota bacterium]
MKDKLLIIGGSGLLGSNLARIAAKDFETYATYNSRPTRISECRIVSLDIRDQNKTLAVFNEVKPNLVIHTAALVDVDFCEGHPEGAWSTNVGGTENVALASKEVEAKLLYISTDSVFDGEKGMYVEEDLPRPLTIYAKTKLEGERMVRHWLPDSLIIRTAFCSRNSPGKPNLAEWIINGLESRKILKMFTDVFFSPIPVCTLIEAMLTIYHKELSGIYHVGGKERCSKFDYAMEIAHQFGLNTSYIQPSTLAEAKLKAPRPKDVSLNVGKALNSANVKLPDLKEGVFQLTTQIGLTDDKENNGGGFISKAITGRTKEI